MIPTTPNTMTSNQSRRQAQKARQAQLKAQLNRDQARQKILQQRRALARRRAKNRAQCESDESESSGGQHNPSAHSTTPPQRSNAQNAAQHSHSTVPETPKYSTVEARRRLYGLRLHYETTDTAQSETPQAQVEEGESHDE